MHLLSVFPTACHRITAAVEFLYDRLVRQPIQGIHNVLEGLTLLVPELAEASTAAIVQGIANQLSLAGLLQVAAGGQQVMRGLCQLAWPLALAALIVVWHFPATLSLVIVVVGLLCLVAEGTDPHHHSDLPNGWRVVRPGGL